MRHFLKRERNYAGQRLGARGYFVDTVGRDTEVIRRYIRGHGVEGLRLIREVNFRLSQSVFRL
jgi:putative transposase